MAEFWVMNRGSIMTKCIASQHRRRKGGGRWVAGKEDRAVAEKKRQWEVKMRRKNNFEKHKQSFSPPGPDC